MTVSSDEYRFTRMKRELARRYLSSKSYQAAESELREALQRYPTNNYVIYDLADLLYRLRRRTEAKDFLKLLLSQNPQDPYALLLMGKILHHEKDYQEALGMLNNSLASKDMERTKLALVNLYIDMGREDEALPYIHMILEKKPEDLACLKALARIHKKKGEMDKALQEYERVIRKDPKDEFAYSEYISLKTSPQSETETIRQLDQVMKVPSRQRNVHLMIKRSFELKKLKQYAEAAEQLQEALCLAPENDYIRQQLGYLYNKMKKYKETQNVLSPSLLQYPKDVILRKTIVAAANRQMTKEALEKLLSTLNELQAKNPEMKSLWGDIVKTEKKLKFLSENTD